MSTLAALPPLGELTESNPIETIREEPLNLERLEEYARLLAGSLTLAKDRRRNDSILRRARRNAEVLRQTHRVLVGAVAAGEPVSIDMEWLLDNFSIVEEQLREIHEDLPSSYFYELPKTEQGLPRVYEIALGIVAHTDSAPDEQTLERFLAAFQEIAPLSIGETWAFPIMLRLALTENLRRIGEQILSRRACRDHARHLVDDSLKGKPLTLELDSLEQCAPTVVEVLAHFEDAPAEAIASRNELEQRLRDKGWDLPEMLRHANRRQAANQVTIGNLITSMRLLSALDWMAFFEQVNLAERTLREDPAEVYAAMDAASRDRYRQELERSAKGSRRSDIETAALAIEAARSAQNRHGSVAERHVGFYLIGDGKSAFRKSLGYQPTLREWWIDSVRTYPMAFYFGGLILIMSATIAALAWSLHLAGVSLVVNFIVSLVALIPASELGLSLLHFATMQLMPPRTLPKLDFRSGIPDSHKTLVVIPTLLTSPSDIESLVQRLESHYLGNPHSSLRFALLTDWVDSDVEQNEKDLALLDQAGSAIRGLNERYGDAGKGPFVLLHRKRLWNASENCFMGWERKRGKLMELHRWMRGEETSFLRIEGDVSDLRIRSDGSGIEYILTLDSDTLLPPGAASKLVGAIGHPLNRPRITEKGVQSGYVLLQPRVGVTLSSANQTWYSQIFANSPGIDPYSTAASDVYQDLFAEGSFTGKGIYDVKAFERCLGLAFPENHILSHDLIEGCHSRVGLLNDVEMIDSFPARYEADVRRQHRWVRGDWQLLPWLMPRVPSSQGSVRNRLSWLSMWKVFDNLRRSVAPAMVLLLLLVGWFVPSALAVTIALSVFFLPLVTQAILAVRRKPRGDGVAPIRYAWQWSLLRTVLQCGLQLVFLPHRAIYMLDAVVRTLYRVCISRRRLLEWESAAVTEAKVSSLSQFRPTLLWFSPALSLIVPFFLPSASWLVAAPVLVAWLLAPLAAYWIDQRAEEAPNTLSADQNAWLRQIARRTWFYFEEFVNEKGNWLPPDNVQEYPVRKIALRVSPTNEGLFLVSGLTARDFGFVNLHDLADLWEKNLKSWRQLEGLNGHPLNWYDTGTLEPLRPRYVSTVDSGNLAVSLLTLHSGIDDLLEAPIMGAAQWTGLLDTLAVAREVVLETYGEGEKLGHTAAAEIIKQIDSIAAKKEPPLSIMGWDERMLILRSAGAIIASRMESLSNVRGRNEADAASLLHGVLRQINGLGRDLEQLFAWTVHLHAESPSRSKARWKETPPEPHAEEFERSEAWRALMHALEQATTLSRLSSLDEVLSPLKEALRKEWGVQGSHDSVKVWLDEFEASIQNSIQTAISLRERYRSLATQVEAIAMEMNFGFLFNSRRRLFSIGFNVDEGRLDQSHYDMLASEARLAAYFSIVKGDTDHRSWFTLGRGLTEAAGLVGLVSWGGTMFEYLMPHLFQKSYAGSLISESCKMAVRRQREYGKQCNAPWGISESAFSALASNHDYHYRSFGVPGLGLKRGLGNDLVVSPYSTMLALDFAPADCVQNLGQLMQAGALGPFGFFDAVDYTKSRMPKGKASVVVRCYMAHHHGMSILAIANFLEHGIIRRRFHSQPLGKAGELLLQEKLPEVAPLVDASDSEHEIVENPRTESEVVSRKITGAHAAAPKTHLLTNGRYSLMMTSSGSGYSVAEKTAITRWRRDATQDHHGQFIYIRKAGAANFWSAGYEPTRTAPDSYEAIFSIDKVELRRRDGDMESHLEVTIAPHHPVEIRTLTLINHSDQPQDLELTSYAEIVLGAQAADLAHPAFQKLFVETEIVKEQGAIIAKRRPRSATEQPIFAFYVIAPSPHSQGELEFESSRDPFLGRGRGCEAPLAVVSDLPLSGSAGAVLDPIFAIRQRVSIPARERVQVSFTIGVASSREEAMSLVDHYRDPRHIMRAFEMAWAFQRAELRQLHITPAKAHQYQRWAGPLIYPMACWRAPAKALHENQLGQPALWRYGVSGDLPILVVRFGKSEHLDAVRELLIAHLFWRRAGLVVDLVFINEYPGGYLDGVQEQFVTLLGEIHHQSSEPPANVAIVRASQSPKEDLLWLEAAASVLLHCDQPDWETKLGTLKPRTSPAARHDEDLELPNNKGLSRRDLMPSRATMDDSAESDAQKLLFANPWGGFSEDGREYVMRFRASQRPPKPWSNVIANPRVGFLITESGGGYSWLDNSREFKLTSWANDPTTDAPSERLYLRDEGSGEVFFPLPQEVASSQVYRAAHAAGYSRFEAQFRDLKVETTLFVANDDPVKFVRVRVSNLTRMPRTLSLTYFVEWVLGVHRDAAQLHVRSTINQELGAILARNVYIPEFGGLRAFLTAVGGEKEFLLGRETFFGRQRNPAEPVALSSQHFSSSDDSGGDPGGAVRCRVLLAPGGEGEVIFLLGGDSSHEAVAALLKKYNAAATCNDTLALVTQTRREELGAVSLRTPSEATNILMNNWLPHQVLACRIWGRSAFYQSGGAYGFRDQLQDVMAIVYSRPDLTRAHLLRAAARQFVEGDVQHWWHPPAGRGTRTRFSDDYLWLPLTTAHYVNVTGDRSVLEEEAPYLTSHLLEPHEHERYEEPSNSGTQGTLYDHCLRTLDRAFRFGAHGLPLMGCGDWNDGMNKVGEGGKGESVWMGWFLLVLLKEFLPLMRQKGDGEKADGFAAQAETLREKLEEAWDGAWYRRAYFDDGTPLGSAQNDECQIDSIAQSWAVMAKADIGRCTQAMQEVWARLVRRDEGLVLLFAPPFQNTALDPGYIKGYLPGIRENGGQYTHAALWVAQALALLGETDRAWEVLEMINPIHHGESRKAIEKYQVEPYVIAADVYGVPPNLGRGGWTWYTGSAAWMYRVILETVLGFELRGDRLVVRPRMPKAWPGFEMSYRYGATTYEIRVRRVLAGDAEAKSRVEVDGRELSGEEIALVDDGATHQVSIEMAE